MKPLIKHEIRRIWGLILLMLVSGVGVSMILGVQEIEAYRWYVRRTSYISRQFLDMLENAYGVYLTIAIVVIVVLVYFQFNEDKVSGTGDFVGTLPYTQKCYYSAKILVGISTILVGWSTFLVGTYLIYRRAMEWLRPLQNKSTEYLYVLEQEQFSTIFKSFISLLLILIIVYLACIVVQYSVYNTLGGLFITAAGVVSVPYILLVLNEYIERMSNYTLYLSVGNNVVEAIMQCIFPYQEYYLRDAKDLQMNVSRYRGLVDNWMIQLILLVAIVGLLLTLGGWLSQTYGLRERKSFIVNKPIEWVFIIGVTVCSVFIPFFMYLVGIGSGWSIIGDLSMVITGCIGFFIASKIVRKERN